MMIEFKNQIFVQCPVKEVFEFLSDFENLPKWNYYVLDVSKLTPGDVQIGTQYRQIRKNDQQKFEVTEYHPLSSIAIKTLPPERHLEMKFYLQSLGEGTQIIDEWKLDSPVPGPLNWLATRRVRSAVSENLEKLKKLLENGQVTLQDGRRVQKKG